MNRTTAITTGALLLALVVSGVPALANSSDQNGRDRRQERTTRPQPTNSGSSNRAATSGDRGSGSQAQRPSAGDTRRDVAVPRTAPRADSNARSNDRQSVNRQSDSRQYNARPNDTRQSDSRQYNARPNDTRQGDSRQYNTRPNDARQYNSRQYDNRRYDSHGYDNRAYGYGGYGYRPYISRSGVRFGLGISIFAGRSYGFRFDYGWAPPYAYRFNLSSGIGYGGMSFLIDPDDAAIYVDGEYVGIAREFDGQPIPLAAGVHEIELQAEGCEPVLFDVTVRPGQVIPYRGSLMQIR